MCNLLQFILEIKKMTPPDLETTETKKNRIDISLKVRAILIGAFILIAYGTAISLIIESLVVIIIIEIIGGLTVLGAAVLYLPILTPHNKRITFAYTVIKCIEGILIIIAAVLLLSLIFDTSASDVGINDSRDFLYSINEYLFGIRFLLLAILFYQSKLIPRFIAIWGLIGSALLILSAVINLIVGSTFVPLYISHLPVITNEIFLAIWLMVKGFKNEYILA